MPSFRELTDVPETLRTLAPTENGEPARTDDQPADLAVVDEVVTFASFLSRQGPTHEALCRAPLGG